MATTDVRALQDENERLRDENERLKAIGRDKDEEYRNLEQARIPSRTEATSWGRITALEIERVVYEWKTHSRPCPSAVNCWRLGPCGLGPKHRA